MNSHVSTPSKKNSPFKEEAQFFEKRKKDHISLSLDPCNEAQGKSGLNQVELIHNALPELNLEDIDISQKVFGHLMATPFLVSSMTAGHENSTGLNIRLAKSCAHRGWIMGVGSQRRELNDEKAKDEWKKLREEVSGVRLMGNMGLSQLIHVHPRKIQELATSLDAMAMIVHTNPLQECVQMEGTPSFANGIEAIKHLIDELDIPVVLKETGCGISRETFQRISKLKLGAVDVSGFGGTHWGRIEGGRAQMSLERNENTLKARRLMETSAVFSSWGIPTVDSLLAGVDSHLPFELWASGGVRTGLDAAKLLAMGAEVIGYAKPILEAALVSEAELDFKMSSLEYQLKTALFCTGCINLETLREVHPWQRHL